MTNNSTIIRNIPKQLIFLFLAAPCIGFLSTSCSTSLTTDTKLRIRILGSLTQPTGATGTQSPMAQVYLFNNIALHPADGTDAVDMYTGDPLELRIVSRPQEVWSTTDLSAHEGVAFSSATVKFDPTIVVVDQGGDNHDIALDTGDLAMSQPFTLTAGEETVITVRASWGKTVTPVTDTNLETTVSAPSFTLFLGDTN